MLHLVSPSETTKLMLNPIGRGNLGITIGVLATGWPRVHDFNRRVAEYISDAFVMTESRDRVLVYAVATGLRTWEKSSGSERERFGTYLRAVLDMVVPMLEDAIVRDGSRQWTMAGGEPFAIWARGVRDWNNVALFQSPGDSDQARKALESFVLDAITQGIVHG